MESTSDMNIETESNNGSENEVNESEASTEGSDIADLDQDLLDKVMEVYQPANDFYDELKHEGLRVRFMVDDGFVENLKLDSHLLATLKDLREPRVPRKAMKDLSHHEQSNISNIIRAFENRTGFAVELVEVFLHYAADQTPSQDLIDKVKEELNNSKNQLQVLSHIESLAVYLGCVNRAVATFYKFIMDEKIGFDWEWEQGKPSFTSPQNAKVSDDAAMAEEAAGDDGAAAFARCCIDA